MNEVLYQVKSYPTQLRCSYIAHYNHNSLFMNPSKTLEQLVEEHNQRVFQSVHDILNRFFGLDVPQIKDGFVLYIAQNAPRLTAEMATSGVNAVHEAIQGHLGPDEAFFNAIKAKSREAAAVWQSEYNRIYHSLPAAV